MCVHAPLYDGHLDAIAISLTVSLEFLQVPRVSEQLHECVRRFFGVRGCNIACYPIDIFPARAQFTFSFRIVCIRF